MGKIIISGIQQIGVGVPDVKEAFTWYRRKFGMDVPVFYDPGTAADMLPYTGGVPQNRHAILAINMQGGGGFEIWQYTSRTPQAPGFEIKTGDLGFFAAKMKARDVFAAYDFFKDNDVEVLGNLSEAPDGSMHFYVKDAYGNIFEIVQGGVFFSKTDAVTAGPSGFVVGVSDIDKSYEFYSRILGYDKVVYDKTDIFEDFAVLPGGNKKFRRVLLKHSEERKGPFSHMFGPTQVELIQVLDRKPRKIYENRFWGDLGFIHICFDIIGMKELKKQCALLGHPFTTGSGDSFDMGEAAGEFAYIEDPDGSLIEFVETHKVPIAKKLNWYLNLKKRDAEKPLPNWMIKALALNRVKD